MFFGAFWWLLGARLHYDLRGWCLSSVAVLIVSLPVQALSPQELLAQDAAARKAAKAKAGFYRSIQPRTAQI